MIDKYNYNNEPSGRVDTLAMALDKCERLEKELSVAISGLVEIKNKGGNSWGSLRAEQIIYKIEELEK